MKLIEDWKKTLKKAWSVRLLIVAGLLSGVEIILPMYSDVIPRGVFAAASGFVTMAALVARVTVQKKLGDDQA